MEKLLISACLLGVACRYDGKSKPWDIGNLEEKYILVPFCPEIYGGLPTPRIPAEITGDEVFTKEGKNVTKEYAKGAEEALEICRRFGIRKALLKERSPACGKGQIYDGTFTGTLVEGNGITARLLMENGIEVFGESAL